jgi:hypothetical protein
MLVKIKNKFVSIILFVSIKIWVYRLNTFLKINKRIRNQMKNPDNLSKQ